MPVLRPDEILRYVSAKGFLSAAEAERAASRWSAELDGPLLPWLARERVLPSEVVDDLIALIGNHQLEGLEPHLPGLILLSLLGRGGRGSVYRAWQPSLKRLVAIKLLSRDLADNREYVQRFLREARVASKVQHRNIVRAFDIGRRGPHTYMVMEYVPGISLGAVLRSRHKLETPDALEIGRAVADALAYTAKVGIVHRDIKPDNIMLDRRGRVKLCDLGLARPSGATELTEPMVAHGTPAYMAPETALRSDIDPQADVYSLGVTLYRALLGRVPFENGDPVEVLRMHVAEQPRGLDGGDMPGAIAELIRRMLDKEPARRPPARELASEFAALQRGIPSMDKHALHELVPGGEFDPHAQSAHEPEPVLQSMEHPALPRPVPAPAPRRRAKGAGAATLAAAVLFAAVYILFAVFGESGQPPNDPRVQELEDELRRLDRARAEAQARHDAQLALLEEAAQRLRQEEQFNAQSRADKPQRNKPSDILHEIDAMRDAGKATETPQSD